MILLTGASGKTGQAIIQALANVGAEVRGFIRQAAPMADLRQLGAKEITLGDLRDPTALRQACADVDVLYHICPNIQPDEVAIAQNVIQAAQAKGVKRFVYHSVLHPQTAAMPHHWQKLRVEELLFQSGLNFTILQPAAYMQNVLASWPLIMEQGIYRTPYATTTRLGMVDLRDVAEAAAKILLETDHNGAIYELAGAEVLSQTDVAALLTAGLERPVRAEAMAPAVWEQGARQAGLGDYQVATLLKMFKYYEQYGFWGNPRVLTGLFGRAPTTFSEFVKHTRQGVTKG